MIARSLGSSVWTGIGCGPWIGCLVWATLDRNANTLRRVCVAAYYFLNGKGDYADMPYPPLSPSADAAPCSLIFRSL